MRKILVIFTGLLLLFTLAGCGFIADGPFGWFYTDHKTTVAIGPAKDATREGLACIHSFFGMVSVGDAGIETAMRNAGIRSVQTVDRKSLSLFGTYSRQCTVVSGT